MLGVTKVAGYCPRGCGQTLFVGDGGHITCSFVPCPDRAAVDRILADGETYHIVKVEAERFHVQHPLRERLNGELFECELHKWLHSLDGPPTTPGRYRAVFYDGDWWLTRLTRLDEAIA